MNTLDKVFGELEYEYGWNGKVKLEVFGKEQIVDLIISGENDDTFVTWQYDSFNYFIRKWSLIQEDMKNKIYKYYCQLRTELGYYDDSVGYPLLNNVNDIIEHIEIDAIVIPVIGVYKERCINIVLSCTWDDENGIGVRVLNEAVDEVGYQDIAF